MNHDFKLKWEAHRRQICWPWPYTVDFLKRPKSQAPYSRGTVRLPETCRGFNKEVGAVDKGREHGD